MAEPRASEFPPSHRRPEASPATLHSVRRRRLLRFGWIAGGMAFLGGQLWVFLKLFLHGDTPAASSGDMVAGPVEQFAPGSVTHLWKERFLLVRTAHDFLALSHDCTHSQCQVDFLPERGIIVCPCHGSQFSVTGTVLAGPALRPLDQYRVTVHDGQVIVHTAHRQRSPAAS